MLFIFVLALLIFGPKRLPEVGRTIGKGMAQFRKATSDLRRTIETEIALENETPRPPGRPSGAAAPQPRQVPLQLPGASLPPGEPASGAVSVPAPVEVPDPVVEVLPAVATDPGASRPS